MASRRKVGLTISQTLGSTSARQSAVYPCTCLPQTRSPAPQAKLTRDAPIRNSLSLTGQTRGVHQTAVRRLDPQDEQRKHSDSTAEVDIVIVGGGVVGLALACAISSSASISSFKSSKHPLRIELIETSSLSRLRDWSRSKAAAASTDGPVDWENRVISLNQDNLAWLEEIGVADHIVKSRLRKVKRMQVWDGLTGSEIIFDTQLGRASASAPAQLSTMVEISNLQQAMLTALQERSARADSSVQVTIRDGTRVGDILAASRDTSGVGKEKDPWPLLHLTRAPSRTSPGSAAIEEPEVTSLRSRLLVGADGANSPVRTYAGIGKYGWSYDRRGLVGTLRCAPSSSAGETNDGHTAWQRYLPTGPIAWLPLSPTCGSMVWTLPPDIAQALSVLQSDESSSGAGEATERSPLGALIDAAFRLPWAMLSPLLHRVREISTSPVREWKWLVPEVDSMLLSVAQSDQQASTGHEFPPPCHTVDARSVASFPLNLSHADTYIGSNLMPSQMPTPSSLLSFGLTLIGANPLGGSPEGHSGPPRARTVLVGDAAHSIHPHLGQGLNLGLRDARMLTQTLEDAVCAGADLGSHHALAPYPRSTYLHNQAVLSAADHMHWIYSVGSGSDDKASGRTRPSGLLGRAIASATVWARSTGVEVLNELDSVKRAMMETAGSNNSRRR